MKPWFMRPLGECCHPTCYAQESGKTAVPLCSRHARAVYLDVANLLETATWWERSEAARPPKTAARQGRGQEVGVVYLVMVGDLLKIGFSTSPEARFRALGVTKVLGTIPGTMQDEKAMLARFGPWWDHGEYFRAEPEALALVREVLSAAG